MIGVLLDACHAFHRCATSRPEHIDVSSNLSQVSCSLGRSTLAPMRAPDKELVGTGGSLSRSTWKSARTCHRSPQTRAQAFTEGQLWQRDPGDSMARSAGAR